MNFFVSICCLLSLFTMASTMVMSNVRRAPDDGRTQVCPTDLFNLVSKFTALARYGFRFEFDNAGFVISAGPPPQAEKDQDDLSDKRTTYLAKNKGGYGEPDETTVKKHYDELEKALNTKASGGWQFFEAAGVYEGEAEKSFVVNPKIFDDDPKVHAEAEKLREAYFQDSYLFFGKMDTTQNPPSRKIILGFGKDNSNNYVNLGVIQKYTETQWNLIEKKPTAWTEVNEQNGKAFYACQYDDQTKKWFGDNFAPSDQCGQPLLSQGEMQKRMWEKQFWEKQFWEAYRRNHTRT